MNPELLAYLKSLGIRPDVTTVGGPRRSVRSERLTAVQPDATAGVGGSRPSAASQLVGMTGLIPALAKGAANMAVVEPTKQMAEAIWNRSVPGVAFGLAAGAIPFGPSGRVGTRALAEKLAAELAEKGGASIRAGSGELLGAGTKGFAVGLGKNSKELVMKNPTVADIEDFIKSNKSLFEGDNVVLGGWVDGDGVAHIEPSELVKSKRKAITLGKERNQQAVWDFRSMSEIRTDAKAPSVPGVVADSAAGRAMRAIEGLPMLNTGSRSPLTWNEFTAEKSGFAQPGDRRFVFTTPEGAQVEVIGQKKGDDFRVSWMGSLDRGVKVEEGKRSYISGAGEIGAGYTRQIGRQLRDITGAKTISGERISGARPFAGPDVGGGREAKRALTDSVYSRVLDAAFEPQVSKRHQTARQKLAEKRQSAAVISGDPMKAVESALGGKPLFDYRSLGRDVEPVAQRQIERNLPVSPAGFATYAETAQKAAEALRTPENMARLDLGLRAGGDKWYYLDPISRAFKEEYGEERGQKLFEDFAKTLGAGSPASDWLKNVERSLWAWPQIRAHLNMLEQPLPKGMGSLTQKVFQRGFQNVVEGKPITAEPYKVAGFTEGLMGNFTPLAADRHVLRQVGSPNAGKGVGYAAVEDAMQDFASEQAGRLGLPPGRDPTAAAQSAMWIGDALAGRVQSQPFPALFDIEQAIRRMANQSGMTPNEVFRKYIIQGSPLR